MITRLQCPTISNPTYFQVIMGWVKSLAIVVFAVTGEWRSAGGSLTPADLRIMVASNQLLLHDLHMIAGTSGNLLS